MNPLHSAVAQTVSPVYMVGGSVRDLIMGNEPADYDFATPLSPDEVEAAVRAAGRRPYLVGKRYGTVGFKVDGRKVEVTTFRTEAYIEGSRRPQVEFVSNLTHDLSRRDFTLNAMAQGPTGRLSDPFKGRADIAAKTIRAVGNPRERFKEDPLRMLRAARFAAQFGFEVDPATEAAAARLAHRILTVSRERWVMELDNLLLSPFPASGLRFLGRTRLLHFTIPELGLQVGYDQHSCYHALPLDEHTWAVVAGVPAETDVRWAALLHDIAKPFVRAEKPGRSVYVKHDLLGAEMVERIGLHLRWSNDRREVVRELVRSHLCDDSPLRLADNAAKIDS